MLVAAIVAYAGAIRPWHLRWSASREEAGRHVAGDDMIPEPVSRSTRAINIGASPQEVWDWLVQIGQERGGFYSYDWLENLVGCRIHSADRIHPEWAERRPGDIVRLAAAETSPKSYLVVDAADPPWSLLLRSPNLGGESSEAPWGLSNTWAFHLEPVGDGNTRLIVRTQYSGPPAAVLPVELAQFVMERGMLHGIKRRAESARADC